MIALIAFLIVMQGFGLAAGVGSGAAEMDRLGGTHLPPIKPFDTYLKRIIPAFALGLWLGKVLFKKR